MGTRNLTLVVQNNEFKVAQYCQWDGYPEGQGKTILAFLHKDGNIDLLRRRLRRVTYPNNEEIERLWKEAGADDTEWVTMEVSDRFKELYPSLSRDTGAKVLDLIIEKPVPLELSHSFAGDSLFCEWAYLIDLDEGWFEVYRGFNKEPTPATSRFPSGADWLEKSEGYEPIKLKTRWPLHDLPSADEFLSALSEEVEDE